MFNVSNNFPDGLFINVLKVQLYHFFLPFEEDFFAQISRSFPLLNIFNINEYSQIKEEVDTHPNKHLQFLSISF